MRSTEPTESATTDEAVQVPEDGPTRSPDDTVKAAANAVAGVVHDPRATVGEVDCTAMRAAVTLDNTRSTQTVVFTVKVSIFNVDGALSSEQIEVAAGDTEILSAALADNAYNVVEVRDRFILARGGGSCGMYVHDPLVTVGDADCEDLSVLVTLDNSRSTDATIFNVGATFIGGFEEGGTSQQVAMAAGETQVLRVSLLLSVRTDIHVYESTPDGAPAQLADKFLGQCGPDAARRATVGQIDCASLVAAVTLDNTRFPFATDFSLTQGVKGAESGGGVEFQRIRVAPWAERTVDVPLDKFLQPSPAGWGPYFRVVVRPSLRDLEPRVLVAENVSGHCQPARPEARPAPRTPQGDNAVLGARLGSTLPETGGGGTELLLLGLALVCGGTALIRSTREPSG